MIEIAASTISICEIERPQIKYPSEGDVILARSSLSQNCDLCQGYNHRISSESYIGNTKAYIWNCRCEYLAKTVPRDSIGRTLDNCGKVIQHERGKQAVWGSRLMLVDFEWSAIGTSVLQRDGKLWVYAFWRGILKEGL